MLDDFDLDESVEAGLKAKKAQEEYPELADLDHEVVTDLAFQNFKCNACGESALTNREPYRVLKFTDMECSPDGLEYTLIFERFWQEEYLDAVEVLKTVKI